MLAFTTLKAIPAIAGALAAYPILKEALRGARHLQSLKRIQRVRRTDWRWRWKKLVATASAVGWLAWAIWTLLGLFL